MKRFFTLMMALVLLVSVGMTAFATESAGSITITNATIGDTYKLYKIFDASYDEDAVSYTLSQTVKNSLGEEVPNKIYEYMFGDNAQKPNPYFSYDSQNGTVTRLEGTDKGLIVEYLTEMIREGHNNGCVEKTAADTSRLTFDGIDYGYYLIDKDSNGEVAVTIDTNTPNVEVIDKNQHPGSNFNKGIVDRDVNGNKITVSENSAYIGDMVDYQVAFDATNYDGEYQIRQYVVKDTKGDGLWVEFDSITVQIYSLDGTTLLHELKKGFYHCVGSSALNTHEWDDGLGDWGSTPVTQDAAEWYLIHRGLDEFEIVIPWMNDYTFTAGTTDYTLEYGDDAQSIYPSPAKVVLNYSAYIEHGASVGAITGGNLWNKVDLSWYYDGGNDGPPDIPTTNTTVYGMGLTKTDADDATKHLAGAVFEIYEDAEHLYPVYVIPTDYEGVYIVDDYGTNVTGNNLVSVRDRYASKLEAYLGPNYATTQKNTVVTPENGKIVILGLAAGTYYLHEADAPDGYNDLPSDTVVDVGPQNRNTFFVITDEKGNAVDIQNATDVNHSRHEYLVTSVNIANSKGVELPSTGGEGTMMLISLGSLIAMAFAVLLINHKKMSVYQD